MAAAAYTGPVIPPGEPAAYEKETGRLEAFSDGVFAIAMTLLVLDLKVPKAAELHGPGGLLGALADQWPTFLAYLTSFLTILVMWVNHHILFDNIRRISRRFLFINGMLLLFVTFVPFPTALLAEYIRQPQARVAAVVYAGTYFVLAIWFNLLWRHASAGHRLLDPQASPAVVATITRQYSFGPPLYLAALGLAFVSVPASVALCLLLAVYFAFTGAFGRSQGADPDRPAAGT